MILFSAINRIVGDADDHGPTVVIHQNWAVDVWTSSAPAHRPDEKERKADKKWEVQMTMAQMLCVAVVDDADNEKHKQQ